MTETATTQSQNWDPERYARNARFVADLGAALVELLAPRAGEHILDLGCGDGALSVELAARGAIVVGVDSGADMVAAAGSLGVDARIGDGQALAFEAEFDAVFSNAALHWMRDADAVSSGVKRALKPGGRFVAEFGGAGNVANVRGALVAALDRRGIDGRARSPWYFPTPEAYRERLEAHGFTVASVALIPRPTPLPGDVRDWLETFCQSFLDAVPTAERAALKDEAAAVLEATNRDADGGWSVDYVRLRVAAHI